MQIFYWNSKTHSLKKFICYVGHLLLHVHAYEFALAWDRLSISVFWSLAQQPTFAHTCNQADAFVMTCYDFSQIQLRTECNVICTETRSVPYH